MTRPLEKPPEPAPQWLLSEVATGLQRLVLLALPGTPAAETIEGTARAWTEAFWHAPRAWDRDLDAPRIAAAFRGIGHRLERFPTPKAILEAMPARPPRPALPEPDIGEAERRRNLRRIARILTEAIDARPRKAPSPRPTKPRQSARPALTPAQEAALLAEARERYDRRHPED